MSELRTETTMKANQRRRAAPANQSPSLGVAACVCRLWCSDEQHQWTRVPLLPPCLHGVGVRDGGGASDGQRRFRSVPHWMILPLRLDVGSEMLKRKKVWNFGNNWVWFWRWRERKFEVLEKMRKNVVQRGRRGLLLILVYLT